MHIRNIESYIFLDWNVTLNWNLHYLDDINFLLHYLVKCIGWDIIHFKWVVQSIRKYWGNNLCLKLNSAKCIRSALRLSIKHQWNSCFPKYVAFPLSRQLFSINIYTTAQLSRQKKHTRNQFLLLQTIWIIHKINYDLFVFVF